MGRIIRWGMLGTGNIARAVAPDFNLVHDAELLAVASRQPAKAEAFAQAYNIDRSYGSYDALLQDDDIDVVYITTPHMRHRDDALACINAGKAVLCEKPFTLNAGQAAEVIESARQQGVFCMEAMWMRFIPLMQDVKVRVDRGDIGDLTHLSARFCHPQRFDPAHRNFNPDLGGGALLDRGVYPISLAHYVLGPPASINSTADIGSTGVDMTSHYQFTYATGAKADLSSSCCFYRPSEAIITGTKGAIRIHAPFLKSDRITVYPKLDSGAALPRPSTGLAATRVFQGIKLRLNGQLTWLGGAGDIFQRTDGRGYQFELEAVTQSLQNGELEHGMMPLDETLAVMQTMDALRNQWGLVYPNE